MARQRKMLGSVVGIFVLMGLLSLFLAGCGDDTGIKNNAPILHAIGAKSVTEGQSLTFGIEAADPDQDELTLWVDNPPNNSLFTDNGDGTGTFVFSPNFEQNGSYAAIFMVSDGREIDSETVVITITDVGYTQHAGIISADETWDGAHNPHLVAGDIEIVEGATLTIEAGCDVYFVEGRRIRAGHTSAGDLIANGVAADPIIFTSLAGNTTPGSWDGITFGPHTTTSTLNYCTVEYGGGNGYGNILVNDGLVTITNCTIRQSSTNGIYFDGEGHAEIFDQNIVTENQLYPAVVSCNYLGSLGGSSLTGNVHDTLVVGGTLVNTSATWETLGVPFLINTQFEIAGGAELTISPGITLTFGPKSGITVGKNSAGTLIANGEEDRAIVFTTSKSPASRGAWNGLEFLRNAGAGCILNNCVIEYAGEKLDGAVFMKKSVITMSNTIVRQSKTAGLFCDSAHFSSFAGNTIIDNAGYPVRIGAKYAGELDAASVYSPNDKSAIEIVGVTVDNIATWHNLGMAYRIVAGDVVVNNGGSLTIEPGVTANFTNGYGISVGAGGPASLIANGTGSQISLLHEAGGSNWRGISFYANTLNTSILDNVTISTAGKANNGGSVYLRNCQVTIRNSQIVNGSTMGIVFQEEGYPIDFTGNVITGHATNPVSINCNKIGFLLPGNTYENNGVGGFNLTGTEVTASATWSNPGAGVSLIVGNTITVAQNVQLTIEPGLELKFAGTTGLNIAQNAALIADGTAGQIKFVASGTANWRGLAFMPGASSSSVLKNCLLSKVGGGTSLMNGGRPAGIWIDNCEITVTGCTVQNSSYGGIWLTNGGTVNEFQGNTFTGCFWYPVYVEAMAVPNLGTGNTFTGNGPTTENRDKIEIGDGALQITEDLTIPNIGVPYIFENPLGNNTDITVTNGATLTVEPGVTLVFLGQKRLIINNGAALVAQGTAGSPITFTAKIKQPDGKWGNWGGIKIIESACCNTFLDHCVVEWGGYWPNEANVWYSYANPATVTCSPQLTNSHISYSRSCGVKPAIEFVFPPYPDLTGTTFEQNSSGDKCF